MAKTIRQAAKEILRESTNNTMVYKKSWWWNEKVPKMIKDKNKRYKELMACTDDIDRVVRDRAIKKPSGWRRGR